MCPAPPGGTGHGEPDWAGHEARAGHLAYARTPSGESVFAERMVSWWLTAPLSELHDVPNEVAASFVLLMIRDAARGRPDLDFGFGEVVYRSIRAAIGRRHLVLPAHEAAWAAVTAANSAPAENGRLGTCEKDCALRAMVACGGCLAAPGVVDSCRQESA